MTAPLTTPEARIYLRRLDKGLQPLPREERKRILAEIGGHLEERASSTSPDVAIAALGSPDDLARAFREDFEAARERQRPTGLARTKALVLATAKVVPALAAWPVAVLLIPTGCFFMFGAVTKWIEPASNGLFLTPPDTVYFAFTTGGTPPKGHDVFGYWISPMAFLLAIFAWSLAWVLFTRTGLKAGFLEIRRLLRRPANEA